MTLSYITTHNKIIKNIIINEPTKEEFVLTSYNDISVLVYTKNNYYNATKVCKETDKNIYHLYKNKSWETYVLKVSSLLGIPSSDLILELDKNYNNKVSGTYIHPKLMNYVCQWCNIDYSIKVDNLMNMINEELHLRNITLNERLQEEEMLIEQLKNRIENENLPKSITTGTIRITHLSKNKYKIYASDIILFSNNNDYVINITNAKKTWSLTKKLLNIHDYEFVEKIIGLKEIYNIYDIEKFKKLIIDVKYNKIIIESHFNIDDKITELLLLFKSFSHKRKQLIIGKIFEYYVIKQLNLIPWSQIPLDLMNKLNCSRNDTGIDAIDINNKKFIQCKYYNKNITFDDINSFLLQVKYHRYILPEFKTCLVVQTNSIIDDEIKDFIDEIIYIDFDIQKLFDLYNIEYNVDFDNINSNNNSEINNSSKIQKYIFDNINLNNQELLENIQTYIKPTYTKEELYSDKLFIRKRISNINQRKTYESIRKYIENNMNKTKDENMKYINNNICIDFKLSSDSYSDIFKSICDKKGIDTPYKEKLNTIHEIDNIIIENWDMDNKDILNILLEKYPDNNYYNSFVSDRRKVIKRKNPNMRKHTESLILNVESQYKFMLDNWDKSNEFLRDNLNISSKDVVRKRKKLKLMHPELIEQTYKQSTIDKRNEIIRKFIIDNYQNILMKDMVEPLNKILTENNLELTSQTKLKSLFSRYKKTQLIDPNKMFKSLDTKRNEMINDYIKNTEKDREIMFNELNKILIENNFEQYNRKNFNDKYLKLKKV